VKSQTRFPINIWVVKAIAEESKKPPERISDEQSKRIRFLQKHRKTDPTRNLIDCLDRCEKGKSMLFRRMRRMQPIVSAVLVGQCERCASDPSMNTSNRYPSFRRHIRAHEAVISHEYWYGDGPPSLGKSFTAKKTAERHAAVVSILQRAAKSAERAGAQRDSRLLWELADKLYGCRPRARCGSLACPKCARAFQRAKTAAQQALIPVLQKANSTKKLAMANVVPLRMTYQPHQLRHLDIQKRNRWLKDILTRAGFTRVMLGSADISWENGFYQLHWHIGMFTSNRKILTKRLKKIFPGTDKKPYDRPVVVSKAWSLGFLPYKDKGIKLPNLLRHNRTHLPELSLVLDQTEPLDLMVLTKLRLSAQQGRLIIRQIGNKRKESR
jgi:hypothetical protein